MHREEKLGYQTFSDIVHLLTKRGKSKAGLSTFYKKLRYISSCFTRKIRRLLHLVSLYTANQDLTSVAMPSDTYCEINLNMRKKINHEGLCLLDAWNDIQNFIMWEFSERP